MTMKSWTPPVFSAALEEEIGGLDGPAEAMFKITIFIDGDVVV